MFICYIIILNITKIYQQFDFDNNNGIYIMKWSDDYEKKYKKNTHNLFSNNIIRTIVYIYYLSKYDRNNISEQMEIQFTYMI